MRGNLTFIIIGIRLLKECALDQRHDASLLKLDERGHMGSCFPPFHQLINLSFFNRIKAERSTSLWTP